MPAAKAAEASFSPDGLNRIFQSLGGVAHAAIAVSGGSDSLALMRLAGAWAGTRLTVLTVDHGLRPGSGDEALKVAAWARAIGLDHQTLRWNGPKPATALQAKAREARYRLLLDWCRVHTAEALLTAHTVDDQAETVLMRLARTSSLDSLAAIAPERREQEIRIIRPLLQLTRERLRAHLLSLGQPWIDDPSNDDQRFERVRIRKTMADLGIGADRLAHLADEARAAAAALWQAAEHFIAAEVKGHPEGYGALASAPLLALLPDLRSRVIALLIRRYGAGSLPEPHERALLAEWLTRPGASRRTLGGALIAKRRASLIIGREPGRIDSAPRTVPPSGTLRWDGRFDVSAPPGATLVPAGKSRAPRRGETPAFVQAALPAARFQGRLLDAGEWTLIFVTR